MKEDFYNYLVKRGYSVITPSGNPSTVYDYIKRIDKICEWENISWPGLARNISTIVAQYDVGGSKQDLGHNSHNAVISALKRFSEFLAEQ